MDSFTDLSLMEILRIIWPFLIVQIALQIYCIIKVVKTGVKNLNKAIWIVIILVFNLFGPILFLLFGVRKDY